MSDGKICIKCEDCGFVRDLKGETKPIEEGFTIDYVQVILEEILKRNQLIHKVPVPNVDVLIM